MCEVSLLFIQVDQSLVFLGPAPKWLFAFPRTSCVALFQHLLVSLHNALFVDDLVLDKTAVVDLKDVRVEWQRFVHPLVHYGRMWGALLHELIKHLRQLSPLRLLILRLLVVLRLLHFVARFCDHQDRFANHGFVLVIFLHLLRGRFLDDFQV